MTARSRACSRGASATRRSVSRPACADTVVRQPIESVDIYLDSIPPTIYGSDSVLASLSSSTGAATYFSVINQRFKGAAEHGVNRMELSPDNPKDGSDKFYKAIVEFARQ